MEHITCNLQKLLELILNQKWHHECIIISDYMPPNPGKSTRPSVVVKYPNDNGGSFLRYSCGPDQGFFWDSYADDMMSVELAIIALSKAPVPPGYKCNRCSVSQKE